MTPLIVISHMTWASFNWPWATDFSTTHRKRVANGLNLPMMRLWCYKHKWTNMIFFIYVVLQEMFQDQSLVIEKNWLNLVMRHSDSQTRIIPWADDRGILHAAEVEWLASCSEKDDVVCGVVYFLKNHDVDSSSLCFLSVFSSSFFCWFHTAHQPSWF